MAEAEPQSLAASSAEGIAQALEETGDAARLTIRKIVEVFGRESAEQLLAQARQIHAAGGLFVKDRSRKRTLGGVFFIVARRVLTYKQRLAVWGEQITGRPPPPPAPPLVWEQRARAIELGLTRPGEVKHVKVVVVGRPAPPVYQGSTVVVTLLERKPPEGLPKGLPAWPSTTAIYVVYMAERQWQRVAAALRHPEDLLVVEGFCTLDKETGSIAVWAQNVSTKLLQRAQREANAARDDAGSPPAAPQASRRPPRAAGPPAPALAPVPAAPVTQATPPPAPPLGSTPGRRRRTVVVFR